MHPVKTTLRVAAAVTLVALPAFGADDVTIVFKSKTNGKESMVTEYLTTNTICTTGEPTESILDTATGRLTIITKSKKEYSEVMLGRLASAQVTANQRAAEVGALLEQAKRYPPPPGYDSTKSGALVPPPPAYTQTMSSTLPAWRAQARVQDHRLKVTEGTGTRNIAGYDTRQYFVSVGDHVRWELWTTTALPLPLEPADLLAVMLGPAASDVGSAAELEKIQGFPLASSSVISSVLKWETSREAVEIRAGAIPASTFEVPGGYKKVTSPLAMALR